MEVNAARKTLELIELLEYIFDTYEKTGTKLPISYLKASVFELKNLIENNSIQINKAQSKAEDGILSDSLKVNQEKKIGLPGRIKPMPAEVRGRVRELVDLISDENSFDQALDRN